MELITYMLILSTASLALFIARKEKKIIPADSSGFPVIMTLPGYYVWIGFSIAALFIFMAAARHFFSFISDGSWMTDIAFLVFSLSGIFVMWHQKIWEMRIYPDHITYINITGKKINIRFDEVKSIKRVLKRIEIETADDIFTLDPRASGVDTLIKTAAKFNISIQ